MISTVSSDTLELLHSRHLLHVPHLFVIVLVDITNGTAGRSRVGPNQKIILAPSGAISDCHTQRSLLQMDSSDPSNETPPAIRSKKGVTTVPTLLPSRLLSPRLEPAGQTRKGKIYGDEDRRN